MAENGIKVYSWKVMSEGEQDINFAKDLCKISKSGFYYYSQS